MPKISTNELVIRTKDIMKTYKVVVMYNKEYHFYSVVPDDFKEIVHHLSLDELSEISIEKKYKKKYVTSGTEYQAVISSETEDECINLMEAAIKILMTKAMVQRDVIIMFYKGDDTIRYNDHKYNKEHPQIGLKLGLTYAVETSVGDKKVYSIYSSYGAFGETHESREEIRLWGEGATIIPDTPENRETLELLYTNFKILGEKLSEFTESSESLMKFIDSNVKLLN